MKRSLEIDKLMEALEAFHNKTPFVKATKENPFLKNKYADFNTVVVNTKKDLYSSGLRVKQGLDNINGETAINTLLIHSSSKQFIETVTPVVHKQFDPQSQGSGITYAKRYAYIAILDLLVDADDDGNLAKGLTQTAKENKKVDNVIKKLRYTKNVDELKKVFLESGFVNDERVIQAKDEQKEKLETKTVKTTKKETTK